MFCVIKQLQTSDYTRSCQARKITDVRKI